MDRREFLKAAAAAGVGLTGSRILAGAPQAARPRAKGVIWLWMGGGMSQFDTFDPKPGSKGSGPIPAMDTSVPGVQFSSLLPRCAEQMKHLTLIRSMSTLEGSHARGTHLMHVGFPAVPEIGYPAIGTVIAHELGAKDFPLPRYIAIDPPALPSSSIFGEECRPFRLNNADHPIPNLQSGVTDDKREQDRLALLQQQTEDFEKNHAGDTTDRLHESAVEAGRLMKSPLLKAFDYKQEPAALRKEYGDRFGINCLLARRLIQAGCPFVEIGMGGWDIHSDCFGNSKRVLPTLDAGLGTLIRDLVDKGMLDSTMVVLATEFGRTPDVNAGHGRDTHASGFTVVLAGAGLKRGCVYGSTGPEGRDCVDPVTPNRLFTTIYTALGIDPNTKFGLVPERERDSYAWPRCEPIKEILA